MRAVITSVLGVDPRETASRILHLVDATAACVNALAILAAPILLMRHRKEAEKKRGNTLDLTPPLATFVELVDRMSPAQKTNGDGPRLVTLADDVSHILIAIRAHADPRNNIDRAIIDAAREALNKYGIASPTSGWDRYSG
jgi:hypothetical protein